LGIGISITGLLLSIFFVKDTRIFVDKEHQTTKSDELTNVFLETSFKDRTLSSITQAGLVNNLNDGMIWGLLPILLISLNYDSKSIGIIAAIYPAVWGIGQLFTGRMADIYSKKGMLFWGMLLQGIAILLIPFFTTFYELVIIASLLGVGTAFVYPTFLSAIADVTNPKQRAESIGVFRLWRDLGYAIGAIVSGIIADLFGIPYAILTIGVITILSSLVIKFRMPETLRSKT
jgi:MFS family permease